MHWVNFIKNLKKFLINSFLLGKQLKNIFTIKKLFIFIIFILNTIYSYLNFIKILINITLKKIFIDKY